MVPKKVVRVGLGVAALAAVLVGVGLSVNGSSRSRPELARAGEGTVPHALGPPRTIVMVVFDEPAAHVAAGARRPDRRIALPGVRGARPRRHLVSRRDGGARQYGPGGPGDARRPLSAPGPPVGRLLASAEPVHAACSRLRAPRVRGGDGAVPDEPVRPDSGHHREPSLARQAGPLPPVRARRAAHAPAGSVVQARAAAARAVAVLPVGPELPPLRAGADPRAEQRAGLRGALAGEGVVPAAPAPARNGGPAAGRARSGGCAAPACTTTRS